MYITAITRCHPGPASSGRGDRVASPAERDLCAPWLAREREIVAPHLIIPVGRLAIDAFAGKGMEAGKKSLAISVRIQPVEKTLTDAEIEAIAAKVVAAVTKATGGVLRG